MKDTTTTTPDESQDRIAERIATSVRDRMENQESSRRRFLNRSVLAGGALLAIGGGTGAVMGQEDEETDEASEMTAAFDDVEGTDLDVLNYALSLEHLENAFYRDVGSSFDQGDFVTAESLQSYSEEQRLVVFDYVQAIGDHESAHVETLTSAVELLGGDPAQEATYDFGVETVDEFFATAQALENTGVAAYAGAAPFIQSPDLLNAALSIHSVEARHAALLNQLNGESPFPNAFDGALSQEEVLDTIDPFVSDGETEPPEETETPGETETATETETPEETETETATETETETGNTTEAGNVTET